MRPVLPLLALALLLAGCVQPAPALTATKASVAQPADPFHPAMPHATDGLVPPKPKPDVLVATPGFAEPNVAAGYDGKTIYVGNPGGVWRSDDGGATWKAPANKGIEGGGDGDVAVDANGTVYYLGLLGNENRRIPLLVSHDKGETWSKAVDLSNGTGSDREWIDVTPEGAIFATWRGVLNATDGSLPLGLDASGGDAQISFNGSPDGGATWTGLVKVGADGDGGPVVHDPVTGTLVIPVVDLADTTNAQKPVVHVYRSADHGLTWNESKAATLPRDSPVEPNGYASDFPVAAFDGNGTLYLVYSADSGTSPGGVAPPEEAALYGVFLQVSHDQGATWSKPRLLSDPTKDARFPWVAAGAPGRIAVAWYENARGVPGEMVPDEWYAKLYESLDADAAAPKGVVVPLTQAPVHVGSLCTAGTTCLAADRSMLDFFEVAIGLDGQPLVAFASSTVGTGLGVAVKSTEIRFATVEGASLL